MFESNRMSGCVYEGKLRSVVLSFDPRNEPDREQPIDEHHPRRLIGIGRSRASGHCYSEIGWRFELTDEVDLAEQISSSQERDQVGGAAKLGLGIAHQKLAPFREWLVSIEMWKRFDDTDYWATLRNQSAVDLAHFGRANRGTSRHGQSE